MTLVRCGVTFCLHNKKGICDKDEISLDDREIWYFCSGGSYEQL